MIDRQWLAFGTEGQARSLREVFYRCSHGELEPLSLTRTLNVYAVRTKDPLERVLAPGYFDDTEQGLRKNDRIEAVCSVDAELAEHALLVVDFVRGPEKRVSLLQAYKRAR